MKNGQCRTQWLSRSCIETACHPQVPTRTLRDLLPKARMVEVFRLEEWVWVCCCVLDTRETWCRLRHCIVQNCSVVCLQETSHHPLLHRSFPWLPLTSQRRTGSKAESKVPKAARAVPPVPKAANPKKPLSLRWNPCFVLWLGVQIVVAISEQ